MVNVPPAAQTSDQSIRFTARWSSSRLSNGATAHVAALPGRRLAALRVLLGAGACGQRPGLPLVLTQCLLQGTARRGKHEFSSRLESAGATVHVTATPDASCIHLVVPLSRLRAATALLSEALSTPALTDHGINAVIRRQIAVAEDVANRPVNNVTSQFRQAVYASSGGFDAPPYLLHQARSSDDLGLGSPAVPAWLIAPCSWYAWGVLPPAWLGA